MNTCRPTPFSRRVLAAAATMVLVALHQPGAAATVTRTYDFGALNFATTTGANVAPPVNLVKGSVTVTFDTGVDQFGITTGIALNSFTLGSLGSTLGYIYLADTDRLFFGGIEDGVNGINGDLSAGTDFFVTIDDASAATPKFLQLAYGVVSHRPNVFFSTKGFVELVGDPTPPPPPAGVPAPGSLALALTAGLLSSGRRRQAPRTELR